MCVVGVEYLSGFIFVISFSFFIYSLGVVLVDNNECDGYKFFIGYICYSFFVAIGGIVTQILDLPWFLFMIYLLIEIGIFLCFIIYKVHFKKKKLFLNGIKGYFCNNYFLFIILAILMIIVVIDYKGAWFNNHLDDGYYITKMANYPYVKNPSTFNYSTGFQGEISLVRCINTFEIEASVFIYLFHITPTLYARFFLAGFNYFLFLNMIMAFANAIFKNSKIKIKESNLQYFPVVAILFCFCDNFIRYFNLGYFFDSNQFASAMYYGSSIVRLMGIMMLLTPFLDSKKISIKMIVEVMCICLVLFSKSTIALPLIVLVAFIYILLTLFYFYKDYVVSVLMLVLFVLGNIFVYKFCNVNASNNYFFNNMLFVNIKSILIVPSVLFTCYSLVRGNVFVKRFSAILLCMILFTSTPVLSSVFSLLSVYTFAGARIITNLNYTFVIFAFIHLFAFLIDKFKAKFISKAFSISLLCLSVFSYLYSGGSLFYTPENGLEKFNILKSIKAIYHNPRFAPESTIALGQALDEYEENYNRDLNVLMTRLVVTDGTDHSLPIIVRSFIHSDKVHIISSLYRYDCPNYSAFKNFSEDDQLTFESYALYPNEEQLIVFSDMVNKYNINCLIMTNMVYDSDLKNLGFSLYKSIEYPISGISYYMYVLE